MYLKLQSGGDLLDVNNNTYVYDGQKFISLCEGDGCAEMDHTVGIDFPPDYWTIVDKITITRGNNYALSVPERVSLTIYYTWIKFDSLSYTHEYIPEDILELDYVKEILDNYEPIVFTSTLNGVVTKIIRNINWCINSSYESWDVRVIKPGYVICDHMVTM
jgi:hypothetical protein